MWWWQLEIHQRQVWQLKRHFFIKWKALSHGVLVSWIVDVGDQIMTDFGTRRN